jgi:hypothetical protein
MSAPTPVYSEPRFAQHLKAAAHFLIRSGVWLSAVGAVCAGGGYIVVHSTTTDNFYPGVLGLASVVLGIALLFLGLLCRGAVRLWKSTIRTA